MALNLDWSSADATPGEADTLTVNISLTGDLDASWRDAFEERARQFNEAAPASHWTVRLSSNDRIVIVEGLSPGDEAQLKEELGTLVERINADVDALSARKSDENQRASDKRAQIEAAADEMTRLLRGGN
jgi:hypothetical protein